jgi:hypothetical protein
MTKQELTRLNRIFADKRGKNEYGEPIYRWFRSPELTYPQRTDKDWVMRSGIMVLDSKYEWTPQIDEDRWVVAQWRREDPKDWEAQFGTEVPWPQRGLYYVTNLMLKEGMEPCESITNKFADMIATQAAMSFRDVYRAMEQHKEQQAAEAEKMVEQVVDDAWPAFDNGEPGKRGNHVSFGGI